MIETPMETKRSNGVSVGDTPRWKHSTSPTSKGCAGDRWSYRGSAIG